MSEKPEKKTKKKSSGRSSKKSTKKSSKKKVTKKTKQKSEEKNIKTEVKEEKSVEEKETKKKEKKTKKSPKVIITQPTQLKGVFMNYRQSRHRIYPKFAIIKVEGFNSRNEAYKLIGKKVKWTSPSGKYLVGDITRVHGKNGQVIARFAKAGLPGQAIGSEVIIY
ncbi:MAG: 50S ribosomal protein L35ae [Promethearchaeota archaeon]